MNLHYSSQWAYKTSSKILFCAFLWPNNTGSLTFITIIYQYVVAFIPKAYNRSHDYYKYLVAWCIQLMEILIIQADD